MEKPNKTLLKNFSDTKRPLLDEVIETNVEKSSDVPLIVDAMEYSLMTGGKRLRPLLTLAVLETLGFSEKFEESQLLKLVSAVELVHTYSLIHDDLPAMDDSDYRRGHQTNHKKFGADIATLAGDGLLTLAFQWITGAPISDKQQVELTNLLAAEAGPNGMVGGQTIDVSSDGKQLSLDELMVQDHKKTGDLFHYSVMAGAVIAGVDQNVQQSLSEFAWNFGLAFQIFDDLNDEPTGENTDDLNKNTYVSLLGEDGAREKVESSVEKATEALAELPSQYSPELLNSFLAYFIE